MINNENESLIAAECHAQADEKKAMLEVENLTKKFGDLLVLDDISTKIYEGEKVVIVGAVRRRKIDVFKVLERS